MVDDYYLKTLERCREQLVKIGLFGNNARFELQSPNDPFQFFFVTESPGLSISALGPASGQLNYLLEVSRHIFEGQIGESEHVIRAKAIPAVPPSITITDSRPAFAEILSPALLLKHLKTCTHIKAMLDGVEALKREHPQPVPGWRKVFGAQDLAEQGLEGLVRIATGKIGEVKKGTVVPITILPSVAKNALGRLREGGRAIPPLGNETIKDFSQPFPGRSL